MPDLNDVVRVVNDHPSRELTVTYGGVKHSAKPRGGQMFLNWAAAITAFGDPYLRDDEKLRARANEWDRIRMLYGAYSGFPETATRPAQSVEELLDRNAPKVSVFDADDAQIFMVLNDPEGENAPNRVLPPNLVNADVEALIEYQRAMELRMAELERRINEKRQEPALVAEPNELTLPDDAAGGEPDGGHQADADDAGPAGVDAPPSSQRRRRGSDQ